jgi:hypothetical protein
VKKTDRRERIAKAEEEVERLRAARWQDDYERTHPHDLTSQMELEAYDDVNSHEDMLLWAAIECAKRNERVSDEMIMALAKAHYGRKGIRQGEKRGGDYLFEMNIFDKDKDDLWQLHNPELAARYDFWHQRKKKKNGE